MTDDELLTTIKAAIFRAAHVAPEKINPDSRFVEDLKMDSLHMMEVSLGLEEALSIEIPTDDLMNVNAVDQLADYLRKRGI